MSQNQGKPIEPVIENDDQINVAGISLDDFKRADKTYNEQA